MANERKPVAYLEAVVRIPLYDGDEYGPNGPGDWWEYAQPGFGGPTGIGLCRRKVTEISRRIVPADGGK